MRQRFESKRSHLLKGLRGGVVFLPRRRALRA